MSVAYTFSLQQVKVAPWLGGAYGSAVQLASTKTIAISQDLITDKALGNSYVTDLESQLIGNTYQLDTAGFDFSVLQVFLGLTATTSGADTVLDINNALLPYFGLVAQALTSVGDMLFFFPYSKVTKAFTWKLDFGKIVVPQFPGEAIQDPTFNAMLRIYRRPTATLSTAVTIPPTA